MTTATRGTEDDEIVTMDLVDEEPPEQGFLTPARARAIFLTLAAIAGIALIVAVVIVATAPSSAFTWLLVALVVLVAVVIAEIVLLVLARPKRTT